ncbi:MAG: polyprenyl synthetase family protein [Candidatus Bipolaricaulota bacterium]
MNSTATRIPPRLKSYRKEIADTIGDYVCGRDGRLHEMINYHLGFGTKKGNGQLKGKAIRSSLTLFTTEALGGDPNEAKPAAVALELIHNFSLVHDDIQDDARTRRGMKSVQARWGPDQAINAGDGLKDLSLLALTQLSDGSQPKRTLTALNNLAEYSLRMIQGQVQDLDYMNRDDVGIDSYLNMIREKTCALLEASFHLGGIYSDVTEEEIDQLTSFGRSLGYVYQIRDDWLGIWGQPKKSGKSAKSDLTERKMSFPVVFATQEGRGDELAKLKELYFREGKLEEEGVNRVREILEQIGSKKKTNEWAEKYWEEARRQLEETELDGWAKGVLEEFGSFLLHRKK